MIKLSLPIFYGLAGICSAIIAGCGAPDDKPKDVLATVAAEPVTLSEFRAFSDAIPAGMKKGATPLAKERQVLESLIDKKLLLLEATAQLLEDAPEFRDELANFSRNRLVELYTKRAIVDQVVISDEEMEAHFKATNRNRALRFSGIMLKTRQEATEVQEKIAAGANFMELAKGRSLHRESGEQGGDVGRYQLKDEVIPPIAAAIFALEVGQISEPVLMNFEGKAHFALFQVTDETSVPMTTAERKVRQEIFRKKRLARFTVLLDSLKETHNPQLQGEQISWLNGYSDPGSSEPLRPPAAKAEEAICILRDSKITLAQFLRDARQMRVGQAELADSGRVVDLFVDAVLTPHLFAAEARTAGLDSHPGLLERIALKRENMLLDALRKSQVDEGIDASEEEARAFYDANPKKFTKPITTDIVEILAFSDTLAQRLKAELLAGADARSLAVTHTLRYGAAHHEGYLSLNVYNQAYYQDIYEQVQEAKVGSIQGPLQVPGGYSIFKVLERYENKDPYNDSARRRSIAYVKISKSKNGYVRYVRGLRDKYPVEIFEDALQQTLPQDN
jgi:parvulin-like peptidyl-prolyl isomerase